MLKRPLLSLLAGLASVACSANAHAEEGFPSTRFSGFGTLGVVHADTNFGGSFVRDLSQQPGGRGAQLKPDSRLGVQANVQLSPQWELVGQAVAKHRNPNQPDADAVEWAFAAYKPTDTLTVRVGRLGADLYALSDFTNVGFGYTGVRPVVDFYGPLAIGRFQGVDVTNTWLQGDVLWKAKLAVGQGRFSVHFAPGPFPRITALTLSRERNGWMVRGSYAAARVTVNHPSMELLRSSLQQVVGLAQFGAPQVAAQARQLLDASRATDLPITYLSLGTSYDRNDWVALAEVMRVRTSNFLGLSGGYGMVGRRFGPFTPYVAVGRLKSFSAALPPFNWGADLAPLAPLIGPTAVAQAQALGQAAGAGFNALLVHQYTTSIGLRWDVSPTSALKFQLDRVVVKPNGTLLWGGQPSGGRAWVGSAALDFVF